jgi:serine/threonine-protein kinase
MGEVYRARDTKLKRHVAIKILPASFAADADRLARFQREAEVLASLNHPNIAAIYGLEDADGVKALVMELVEGEDLSQRIARGAIPIDEALPIAKQIADALEAAHEQGIVHRDLKPANIKLRPDGTVKVLDFGLAKLAHVGATAGPSDATAAPTITSPAMMTGVGVLLGTAAYMSPEQAKGREADKRSDIWAFGCVLYEMLTGTRPFDGEDVSDTLANVLKIEPDWKALPADIAPPLRTLVQRCLAKDRRLRVADISTALFVMNESMSLVSAALVHPVTLLPRLPLWRRLVMPAAALIVGGASVGAGVWLFTRPGVPQVTRFSLSRTGSGALTVDPQSRDLTVTPDGSHYVYRGIATNGTGTQLFVRARDHVEVTPLTALGQVPRAPFSSPDGHWIGFVEVGNPVMLTKVAISGGSALPLCALDGASRGATWGDDDSIIFATAATSTGLQRVSSGGGEPTVLTKPNRERGESDHLWPQFLPGSHAVLFTITATTGGIGASQVAVLDMPTGTVKILVRGASQAYYVPSGHLVYVAAGTLRAAAFDLTRLEVTGTAVPVLSQVVTLPTGTAEFDIARDGTLVYVAGGAGARTLVWFDRQGRDEAVKGAPADFYSSPRLSPDGTRVALDIRDQQSDVWVFNFAGETLKRVTTDPGNDLAPVWMPHGDRLVFSSQAGGTAGSLYWQAADGTGKAERLTESRNLQRPSAVLADSTRVLFSEFRGFETGLVATAADVITLTLEKDRRVEPLVQSPFVDRNGVISPDGRWLAYESDDSRQLQIVVRPYPNVNAQQTQVSTVGGTEPRWAQTSQELFYLAPDGALMSVPWERGPTWRAGIAIKLFNGPRKSDITNNQTYDVSRDGKRFLMIKEGSGADQITPSIEVVQNWTEELKRLVPTR